MSLLFEHGVMAGLIIGLSCACLLVRWCKDDIGPYNGG